MAWRIEFDPDALEELGKLDGEAQRRILRYLRERVTPGEDPHQFGKPLRGELKGLWRYRVGAFRVVCRLEDDVSRVLVLRVAHRREVYQ